MHLILEHHEILPDLEKRCIQLAERHRQVFGNNGANTESLGRLRARGLARPLSQPGGNTIAALILTHLVDETERRGTEFWRTPLGRACGWWTGGGQLAAREDGGLVPSTPSGRAGALLGVSRQAAFQMMTKGTLRKNSITGVEPADVRREMQSRWPL